MPKSEETGSIVDANKLPAQWPTHRHSPEFWEALGRTVATFGFLEEALGKAIFALSRTKEYTDDTIAAAFKKWLPQLEKALSDPLGPLIDTFSKSVRERQSAGIENHAGLIEDLRKAAMLKNVLCHGSWRVPDSNGASVPHFINRQMEIFDAAVDVDFLEKTQRSLDQLACEVVNAVSYLGFQFPGSNGPGKPVWPRT